MSCLTSDKEAVRRFAIYYTPSPEHPLTRAAVAWLGRDAFADQAPEPSVENLFSTPCPVRENITAEPKRYGFHATLKAPFRLRPGTSILDLELSLCRFAQAWSPSPIGPLKIEVLDNFFALVPVNSIPALRGFSSRVVEEFDNFRAPMNQTELQRRLRSPLGETETIYLAQWGYPYVFDHFRFHMTLTGRIPAEDQPGVRKQLDRIFQPLLAEDYAVDALSLFVQEHPDADFVVRSQFLLRSRTLLNEGA